VPASGAAFVGDVDTWFSVGLNVGLCRFVEVRRLLVCAEGTGTLLEISYEEECDDHYECCMK
jgi:hypothetical protein